MKKLLLFFLSAFLFLLPWQTIYITREVFVSGAKWQLGTLGFFATEILLWVCVGIFVFVYVQKFRTLKENTFQFRWSSDRIFVASILLFLLYGFTSILWSLDKQLALQQSLHIIEAFLLFFLLSLVDFDKIRLVKCFVAGALVQSLLGIYQFLTQSTFSFKWLGLVVHPVEELGSPVIAGEGIGRVLRAYGAFSHPNVFGGYLMVAIFLTLYLLFQEKKNKFLKVALLLEFATLFFTFSRSAWLTLLFGLVGLCLYFIKTKKWSELKIIASCFVFFTILSAIYFPLVHTRVTHQSSYEIRSSQERVDGVKDAIHVWKTAPWIGVGVGNYTAAFYKQNPTRPGYEYQPVHNVPLLVLSEFGVFGLGLLLFVVATFFRLFPKGKKVFFAASILVFGLLSIFDHYLYSSYIGLLLSGMYFAFMCCGKRDIDKMSSKE